MKYKINEEANKLNIKTFKLHCNIFRKKIFTCVLCNEPVSLEYSYSNEGDHLMCLNCYYEKFNGNWDEALKFMGRDY